MYVDYAATTPLSKEVKEYLISILNDYGNPSSSYAIGNKSKRIIETARENVRNFLNAKTEDTIIFTSSGSASNSLMIKGLIDKIHSHYLLFYSPTSHKSMRLLCSKYADSKGVLVDKNGFIDIKKFESQLMQLPAHIKPILALEYANSEIGCIQDITRLSELIHKYNGYILVDCTGFIPYYPVDVQKLNLDFVSFSGHKLHALKGIGVVYAKKKELLTPLIYGSQEHGLFGGTENVLGIASLGKAVESFSYTSTVPMQLNRNYVYKRLLQMIPNCYLIGKLSNRIPNNLYMCFSGINADQLVTSLDLKNIQVSTGSACNNGSVIPSPTLLSIGVNKADINSCIRLSFGGKESIEDLDYLCESVRLCVELLRE